jgi:predicted O-linked N-acetylglucosamine transferase (SPINDLY family)
MVRRMTGGRPMAASPQALRAAARGDRLADQGRLLDALRSYEQALRLAPQLVEARINAGLTLSAMGKHGDALATLQRAAAERPDLAPAHLALGDAQREAGDLAVAEASYRRALELAPRLVGALCNLGATLRRRGRLAEATDVLDRAVALAPDSVACWLNRANVLQDRGQLADAEAAFRRTLALAAGNVEALAGLGATLEAQSRYEEALVPLERALALRRDDPAVLAKLAHLCMVLGRQHDARGYLRRARGADSLDLHLVLSFDRLLHGAAAEAAALLAGAVHPDLAVLAKVDGTRLLYRMHDDAATPAALLSEHRAWTEKHAAPLRAAWAPHANDRTPGRTLRVGFVSADLRKHAVATFLEPLLAALDRSQIAPVLYANVARPDAVSARLQALARWEAIAGEPADAVAARIRAQAIDILVDLGGHTNSSQLLIFARRPAPVQATWLGYPGTTGLDAIDWRISDAACDPPRDDALSTERVMRLPGFHCYAGPGDAPAVAPLPAATSGTLTFGSFNNIAKLSDACVALYARVLAAVPGARLLLKSSVAIDGELSRFHLARFAAHGIAAERVAMLPWAPSAAAHLAGYGAIDIALDSTPYCGTTTTCEALWMGVPVVTLAGDRHAARVGASLLGRAGLEPFVARTADTFVAIAASWTDRIAELAGLRARLRAQLQTSPLGDAAGFARDMAAGLRAAWHEYCRS